MIGTPACTALVPLPDESYELPVAGSSAHAENRLDATTTYDIVSVVKP